MTKRLFVAISFSDAFNGELDAWLKKLRKTADRKEIDVRWTSTSSAHVTLAFIGDTPVSRIADVEAKLQSVSARHAAFPLKIRKVGGFPSIEHARVLWLGVQKSQRLLRLQADLADELQPPTNSEHDDYAPHLSFGRLRNPRSCRDLLSPFHHADFGRQPVREILLFESVQSGTVTVHRVLSRASLQGDAAEGSVEL